ncbi:MAG: M3 family oligoendopeptidase [Rickettsiales bacterium]|jgi:oligoendopeptidase F|nr:M3 family oligoendopeptidase [Rickettsiales bacterium]
MELSEIRWDLSPLYAAPDAPEVDADIVEVERRCKEFDAYRGQLSTRLAEAVAKLTEINEIADTLIAYFYFLSSRDTENQGIKKRMSQVVEAISRAESELAFFDIELGKLDEQAYLAQIPPREKPWADRIRLNAKYQLGEKVEEMLGLLSPFGAGEWDDMMDEMEAKLEFHLTGKTLNLSEIVHLMSTSNDAGGRRTAMEEFNKTLASSNYMLLRTRTLNVVAGLKGVSDRERGFKHPMSARNISNNLDDKTVDALHKAVETHGAAAGKRYYKLLAKLLGTTKLSWADRNAPLPFEENREIPWNEALETVKSAYRAFSPTLADLIEDSIAQNRIDAPTYKGKNSGAYNYTVVGREGKTTTWTFLNYLGSTRDVMTLAHELGHSVHGQLAGAKQGNLLAQAPMAYAETASIFGEMLTFEHLLANEQNPKARLALLMGKANDWLNSVNRQISFSLFEQKLHAARAKGKVEPAELCAAWVEVSKQMYGDIFEYKDMENLWSYVGHFTRPFYVYAYSFGELFTQSLFARRAELGEKFEPLYLEMLASGGAKNAIELMEPFGLDPRAPDFWKQGIDVSIGKWLDDAETLAAKIA